MSDRVRLSLTVDGARHDLELPARRLLVDALRHDLGEHSVHVGCEQGVCGMCTVLLDGQPVKSCLMFAPQADGLAITTVRSFTDEGDLHPLQESFRGHHALQCGYCTPAFLLTAEALAERSVARTEQDVREELAGVLCRCTGYQHIVDAVCEYLGIDNTDAVSDGSSQSR